MCEHEDKEAPRHSAKSHRGKLGPSLKPRHVLIPRSSMYIDNPTTSRVSTPIGEADRGRGGRCLGSGDDFEEDMPKSSFSTQFYCHMELDFLLIKYVAPLKKIGNGKGENEK